DIVHLRAYGGMEPLAQAGYLVRLDDKVPALADFDPGILAGATNRADGGVYGVPFALQTVQVLYNVDMFERLGLEEPQTWDEFFQSRTGGRTDFTDRRFAAALERMVSLRPYLAQNYMGVGYTDMQSMFAFEQAGMFIAGSYELGILKQLNPLLRVGAFPVPGDAPGEGRISYYVDGSYGINAASPNQEAALRFIEFLASQEYGQMFSDELQQISAVPGVTPTSPELSEIVGLMNEVGTPYLMLTAFRFGQPSGSTLLQNEMQAVLAGDKSVADAVANIQRGVAEWYDFR